MIQEVEGGKVSIRRKISPNLEKAIKQIRINWKITLKGVDLKKHF